jgi:hypothetical protein
MRQREPFTGEAGLPTGSRAVGRLNFNLVDHREDPYPRRGGIPRGLAVWLW